MMEENKVQAVSLCSLTNRRDMSLPGGTTPHLNNNATKEHYTNESECECKGGTVYMEQNWAEQEDHK